MLLQLAAHIALDIALGPIAILLDVRRRGMVRVHGDEMSPQLLTFIAAESALLLLVAIGLPVFYFRSGVASWSLCVPAID